MNRSAIWVIMAYTFKDSIRAKWLIIFAGVFFLLAINIPMLVLVAARYLPPDYLGVWLSTLVLIAFPFIPLLPLPMGAATVVDERESGTLQYMMSNPISKADFLIGRLVGMLAATTSVILLGFGVAAVLVYNVDVTRYGPLVTTTGIAALLNAIMLGVAIVISIVTKRKSTATGIAIFVWFIFTVLSDVGFLSVILNFKAGVNVAIIPVLLNPVEASRLLALFSLGGGGDELGPTGLILRYYFGSTASLIILVSLVAWLISFLALALVLFRRQDVV